MNYYYSQKTGGFYPESLKEHYENSASGWPTDAVLISEQEYTDLHEGHARGKSILPGKDGKPILSDQVDPDLKLENAVLLKKMKMSKLNDEIQPLQDAVDLDMASEEEADRLKQLKRCRVLLSRIDTSQPETISWPV